MRFHLARGGLGAQCLVIVIVFGIVIVIVKGIVIRIVLVMVILYWQWYW